MVVTGTATVMTMPISTRMTMITKSTATITGTASTRDRSGTYRIVVQAINAKRSRAQQHLMLTLTQRPPQVPTAASASSSGGDPNSGG